MLESKEEATASKVKQEKDSEHEGTKKTKKTKWQEVAILRS